MAPKRRRCPHCGGAGEIEIRAFAGGASPFDRRLPCGFCAATGYVTDAEWRRYNQRNERTK